MRDPSFTRKIYIDSRQATQSSRSTSDFDVVLGRGVVLPPKAAGFVTDIHIPHSWYTVGNRSQYLYVRIKPASGSELGFRVQLPKGNYTGEELATELQTLLRTALAGLTTVNAGSQFYVQYQSVKTYSNTPWPRSSTSRGAGRPVQGRLTS